MELKKLLAISLVLIGILGAGAAAARGSYGGHGSYGHGSYGHGSYGHGSHVHFGVGIGVPLFWPGYYSGYYSYPWAYGPTPYYPSVVSAPAAQPVYIEREEAAPSAPSEYWWYYCAEARTYYPYVRECPGGWQRVSPRPPS